jgi:photosystem II stability/assembly factor-like uncharacterized protein
MGWYKRIIAAALALAALAGPASGAEGLLIKIYYDGAPGRLADTSFVPYAVYDEYAIGEVSVGYAGRLAERGFRFDVIADDPAQKGIWEIYPPAVTLPPGATVLAAVSPTCHVVAAPAGVDLAPGDTARRLGPIPVDFAALGRGGTPPEYTVQNEVGDIVGAVNRDRYEDTVRRLVAFGTRYSYSPRCKEAADYVDDALATAGYDVRRDRYFGPVMNRVSAAGTEVAWAAGNIGVVARTTDGGESWNVLGRAAENVTAALCVACTSADEAWVGFSSGLVAVTADGGANWDTHELGTGDVNDICFIDSQNGWAATTAGHVYRTTNGGNSWSRVATTGEWLRGIAFADAETGLLCGSYGYLARTTDGGANWTRVNPTSAFRLESVAYGAAAEAYAVGEGGTALRSTDGGTTWTALDLGTESYLYDVAWNNNTGVIVGSIGQVWRKAGAGEWQRTRGLHYIYYSAAIGSANRIWCGASSGALLYSGDGGATWEDQAKNADPTSTYVWENVWTRKEGRGGLPGTVLVCAHYDSISELSSLETPEAPAPGADDNATGVAAVLECARASRGRDYRRDVIFVCYSGEELGLFGSSHFAARMASIGEPLLAVLNVDMIGYADSLPENLAAITNYPSNWISEYTRSAGSEYVSSFGVDTTVDPLMRLSDHAPYWAHGYESNLFIEDWPLTGHHGNTTKDTLDKVNFDLAVRQTKGIVASAVSLASPVSLPASAPLDDVEVYPNPYKLGTHAGRVFFANLPAHSTVKFYNLAGEFVAEGGNGVETLWPFELEMKTPAIKASGVYFYIIETPTGDRKTGKLAVIR